MSRVSFLAAHLPTASTLPCSALFQGGWWLWTAWPVNFGHWLLPSVGTAGNLKGRERKVRAGYLFSLLPPFCYSLPCLWLLFVILFSQILLSLGCSSSGVLHLLLQERDCHAFPTSSALGFQQPKHSSVKVPLSHDGLRWISWPM